MRFVNSCNECANSDEKTSEEYILVVRFHMETPEGEQGRYDITRSQAHHEVLFALAGLQVRRAPT